MGCCIAKKTPHVNCINADELQKLIENEESELQILINNLNNSHDTNDLNYKNRLYIIKASLTQLHLKIEEDKDKVNNRKNSDWEKIMKIMDIYYEMKSNKFEEKIDSNSDKNSNKNEAVYSLSKAFVKEVEIYLGKDEEH